MTTRTVLTIVLLALVALAGCEDKAPAPAAGGATPPTTPAPTADAGAAPVANSAPAPTSQPGFKPTEPPKMRTRPLPDEQVTQKESYLFEFQPYTKGERFTVVSKEENEMKVRTDLDGDAREGTNRTEADTVLSIAIDAVLNGKVVASLYSYHEARERQEDQGNVNRFQSPVSNKTFLVTQRDDGPRVTYRSGADAANDEQQIVSRDVDIVNKSGNFFDILPKRPLKPGEALEVSADQLKAFAFAPGARILDLKDPTMTFKEVRRVDGAEAGIFEMKMSVTMQEGPLTISLELTGELAYELGRGRLLRTVWSGPLMMTGTTTDQNKPIKIGGTGQTRQEQVTLYDRPDAPDTP